MAYVLVAVGAMMFGLGLYAAVTGSRIVQVEAGWTSVIAGSMLLVGGVLTMALGLVLRAVLQLKASLPTLAATRFVAPLVETPPVVDASGPEPSTAEAPTDVEPAKRDLFPKLHPLRKAKVPPIEAPLPPAAEIEPPPREPEPAPLSSEAGPDSQPATPDPIEAAHPADDYKLETPSTPVHDLPPVLPKAEPTLQAPAEVDWLDRAFAEIDEDLPVQQRMHKSITEVHAAEDEPPHVPGHQDAAKDEPLVAAPHEPADLPAPTSAVIGRYEADGTSYVMYADGSIEAHSEAGSYRFASMAELKAFIET